MYTDKYETPLLYRQSMDKAVVNAVTRIFNIEARITNLPGVSESVFLVSFKKKVCVTSASEIQKFYRYLGWDISDKVDTGSEFKGVFSDDGKYIRNTRMVKYCERHSLSINHMGVGQGEDPREYGATINYNLVNSLQKDPDLQKCRGHIARQKEHYKRYYGVDGRKYSSSGGQPQDSSLPTIGDIKPFKGILDSQPKKPKE